MNISEILNAAADLIEPEGMWIQNVFWRLDDGTEYGEADSEEQGLWGKEATCFCLCGAIGHVLKMDPDDVSDDVMRPVRDVVGVYYVVDWNDADGRTQVEVVTALRRAAQVAQLMGDA